MISWYSSWNRKIKPVLWVMVALGMLSALPFAFVRGGVEQTSNRVEFVFDYRDLLEVSSYRSKPAEYMLDRLAELKAAGVHSMAVYESSLRELELSGRIQTLSSAEAALLTDFRLRPNEKSTYVLFLGDASESLIRPIVRRAFDRLGVEAVPWSYGGLDGLELAMPKDEAMLQAMDPDPITMAELKSFGFHLVVRLSDQRQPFDADRMSALLDDIAGYGVTRIIFEGDAVAGAADDAQLGSIAAMAELMSGHGIGLAAIELSRAQKGFAKLAHLTGYNVVRLHSLPAAQSGLPPEDLADRFALAVQDRNIRMIFLNSQASLDTSLGIRKDTLHNLAVSLEGEDGAIARIQKSGFAMGVAEPFADGRAPALAFALKALVSLGALALIVLLVAAFAPGLALLAFAAGAVGSAGLYVLSTAALSQALALGAGIAAATLAIVYAVRRTEAVRAASRTKAAVRALVLLAASTLVSAVGVVYIVGLLDHITYLYVLRQYRGVALLHIAPVVLAFAYVLFWHDQPSLRTVAGRIRKLLMTNVTVLWVAAAGIVALAAVYYLSRTGNAGQTSDLERLFRAALQDTLGVRPRTKEFLLAHPLFLLGAFVAATAKETARRTFGWLLLAVGSIGQLSIVDTFAHLHTPLGISSIRVLYGLLFGSAVGLALIGLWRLLEMGWSRWSNRPERS